MKLYVTLKSELDEVGERMNKKRFKVQNMLKDFIIGDDTNLETLQELVEKYGSTVKIELFITDNDKKMTYGEVETLLNNLTDENKKLKKCDSKSIIPLTSGKGMNESIELNNLCNKINNKMKEVYIKTPQTCYIDYKNQLYLLLKKMDSSIESFNQ